MGDEPEGEEKRMVCYEEPEKAPAWLLAVPVLLVAVAAVIFTAKKKKGR